MELESLTPDDPRFWEVFEAIGHRLQTTLGSEDGALDQLLASLPEAGEAWFREQYGDELADEIKAVLPVGRLPFAARRSSRANGY